jgi:hypothetical protein
VFDSEKYQALFGPQMRLITIIAGLKPDEPLTEDSLTFDPAKMKSWVDRGEKKAQEVIQETPFT